MKPSAIHPVISINSIYRYFTADHISYCKQRIIEIITHYYDVSHTCHLQRNQKRVGAAESDPKTTGPADNLREDAAEAVDEEEDSAEPA
jgi:hypothetical protein